jgi:hypothetical protein
MGKNQSASGLTNVIQYDNNGNIAFVSGSTTLMQVSSSGAITTTGTISGSSAQSASLAQNSNLLQGTGSVGFATTASFAIASGSISTRVTQIEQVYATTGSNSFRATQSITGSLTVTGQITAQTLNVQQVTSSIIYSSGSNVFGCDLNSRQTFTGSFYQTGSAASFSNCIIVGGALSGTSAIFSSSVTALGGIINGSDFRYAPSGTALTNPVLVLKDSGNSALDIASEVIGDANVNSRPIAFRVSNPDMGRFEAMRITSCGNVLIGTATALASSRQQLVIGGNGFGSLIAMGNNGNGNKFVIESDSSENVLINNKSNTPMIFYTNNSRRFDITSGGIACFACQVCAPSFVGGTISGTGITGTSMTVATDCSGVIVDVASRHGLMKYFNFSTGFVGACSGTDGSVSTWLGRFAGSITAPTAVYQDLRILNSGIAVFACQVCTPVALIGSTCTTGAGINFLGREGYREKWLITQGRWRFCFGTEDFYGAIFIEMYGTNYNQGTSEVRVGKAAIPLRYGQSRSISNIYQLGGVCVGAYLANGIGLVWCNINGTVGDLIYTNAGSRDPDSVLATELQLLSTGFSLAGRFYRMCYTSTLYESTNPYV